MAIRMGKVAILLGLGAILAACASGPATERRIEASRIVSRTPEALVPRIVTVLERRQIDVLRADPGRGRVEGAQQPLADPAWANCEPFYVRDTEGERRRQAAVLDRRLELTVILERLSGQQTLVTVRPAFIGTFHNSFTNSDVEAPCASSEQLERALLEAF